MRNFIANEHEKIDDNNEKWGKHDKTNDYVTVKDIDQPGQWCDTNQGGLDKINDTTEKGWGNVNLNNWTECIFQDGI